MLGDGSRKSFSRRHGRIFVATSSARLAIVLVTLSGGQPSAAAPVAGGAGCPGSCRHAGHPSPRPRPSGPDPVHPSHSRGSRETYTVQPHDGISSPARARKPWGRRPSRSMPMSIPPLAGPAEPLGHYPDPVGRFIPVRAGCSRRPSAGPSPRAVDSPVRSRALARGAELQDGKSWVPVDPRACGATEVLVQVQDRITGLPPARGAGFPRGTWHRHR